MKIVKPQKLGLLTRTFEHKQGTFFVLTLAAFFPLEDSSTLLPEVALWKFVASELGTMTPLDEGLPKQRGELLVSGRAYPPGGCPQIACHVQVRVGAIHKELRVVGDRYWQRGGVPSDPEPFREMPLTYAHAFGGPGFTLNPLGKGSTPVDTPRGRLHPLPNVEDPRRPVRGPGDEPAPTSLLPYDPGWPQRLSKAGTYDRRWLELHHPGFAEDVDWSFFNTAPEDQWLAGYFQGGEHFVLENLHPTLPRIEGILPRLSARAFITQSTAGGDKLHELSTRLDTVWLFPHALRGVLLFRALAQVVEDDAADVLHCLAAFEELGSTRPAQHYEQVLKRRLDKEKGFLFALRDDELLPASAMVPSSAAEADTAESLVPGDSLRAALQCRFERERERAREMARQAGVDPDSILPPAPPEEPAPTLEELPDFIARTEAQLAEQQRTPDRQRAEAEQEARRICAEHGIDYDQVMGEAQRNAGGLPRFSAREELAKLEQLACTARRQGQPQPELESLLASPEFIERLVQGEAMLRETYRRHAHRFPPAAPRSPEAAARLRARAEEQHRSHLSLAGEDLTGADLADLDLSGAELSGALMEHANLRGANLRGANLAGAVLARADLSGAVLSGACLREANLGASRLSEVRLDEGADLTGANLSGAELRGASLRGAKLAGADLSEAQMEGVDFREVTAEGTTFLQSNLSQALFCNASLSRCLFLECTMLGADFSGANLASALFLAAKGDGVIFHRSKLGNLRLVQGCSFARSDFRGADLTGANLRGTMLQESDLSGAMLNGSDLSECDLRGARLYRAVARESRWVRANLQGAYLVSINLMNAVLQKADISGSDFTGANLFRADFAKVRGKASSLRDALLIEVRLTRQEAV